MYARGGPVMKKDRAQLYSAVDEVFGFVRGPGQSMEISEVERSLLSMLMRVGRQALISYLDEKGSGYQGEEIVNAQGKRLPYVRDRKSAYRSVFGLVEINRAYYQGVQILSVRSQAALSICSSWRSSSCLRGIP
jgi:hypothetical protein